MLGVDTGKDAIYSRLGIQEPGPGFIHFPSDDAFGEAYFAMMLTAKRREARKRAGHTYTAWVLPPGKRNEALDTMVGTLAVRPSLPRWIEKRAEFATCQSSGAAPPTTDVYGRALGPQLLPRRPSLPAAGDGGFVRADGSVMIRQGTLRPDLGHSPLVRVHHESKGGTHG